MLAVVPARGGSKGLPGKNIRPLVGVPLIGHTLLAARLVPAVTRCIVSTDSDEIAKIARDFGADVPFIRPPELAADDTPMMPVLKHALAFVEDQERLDYDFVLLLDPTSPARDPQEIHDAVQTLAVQREWDGVVSVSEPAFNPVWVGVRRSPAGTLERFFQEGAGVTRRQQLSRYLRVNGNFYIWRAPFIRRVANSWMDEGIHGMIEIPEARAFAIDYGFEFDTVEALVQQGTLRLPWMEGLAESS